MAGIIIMFRLVTFQIQSDCIILRSTLNQTYSVERGLVGEDR
jgi:hypothetical protein